MAWCHEHREWFQWAQRCLIRDQSSQGAESSFPAGPKLEFVVPGKWLSQLKSENEAFKIRSRLETPPFESFQLKMFCHTYESLTAKPSKLCFPAVTHTKTLTAKTSAETQQEFYHWFTQAGLIKDVCEQGLCSAPSHPEQTGINHGKYLNRHLLQTTGNTLRAPSLLEGRGLGNRNLQEGCRSGNC